MSTNDFNLYTVLAIIALAFAMLATAVSAHADTGLVDKLIAAQHLPGVRSATEETVDERELAEAIATTTSDPQWAALELAVMSHESALSARIARGEFKDAKADPYKSKDGTIAHRAWGLGQLHANKLNEHAWGSPELAVQVAETSKALRRGFYSCQNRGEKLRADWVARTINGFAGRRCDAEWPGLDKRVATFQRVRKVL